MDAAEAVALLYRASRTGHRLSGTLSVVYASEVENRLTRKMFDLLAVRTGKFARTIAGSDDAPLEYTDIREPFQVAPGESRRDDSDAPGLSELLHPAWLLAGFDVTVHGTQTFGSRLSVALTATHRPAAERHATRTTLLGRIEALVDVELGILLRTVEYFEDEVCRTTELVDLVVDPLPHGAAPAPDESPDESPEESGEESGEPRSGGLSFEDFDIKVPAPVRLVARGIGAAMGEAVRLSARRQQPTEQTDDEPWFDEAVAAPLLSGGLPSDGDLAWLLHRSGRGTAPFTAELHHWADTGELVRAVQSMRAGSPLIGGLSGPDSLWSALNETNPGRTHTVHRLLFADLLHYRLDVLRGNKSRRPVTVSCDGATAYRLYSDRLVTARPQPPDFQLSKLLDLSWLLRLELTLQGWSEHGGRRALKIAARRHPDAGRLPHLPYTQMEVLIDAELGIALQYTDFHKDRPIMRSEVRDLRFVDLDDGDLRPAPPHGGRTVESDGGMYGDSAMPPLLKAAAGAATALAGGAAIVAGLLGNKRHQPPPAPPVEDD